MATTTPTSPLPPARLFLRLHVGGFALACGVTAFIAGLVVWAFQSFVFAGAARYGMYGPYGPGMHPPYAHPGFPILHLVALVIFFIWAVIFGAILAALYNAFSPKA